MGKKDKEKKKFNPDCPLSKKECKAIADNIESYIDLYSVYIIKEGVKEDAWKKNVKEAKKMINNIRAGEIDGIIDMERYEEINGLPFDK